MARPRKHHLCPRCGEPVEPHELDVAEPRSSFDRLLIAKARYVAAAQELATALALLPDVLDIVSTRLDAVRATLREWWPTLEARGLGRDEAMRRRGTDRSRRRVS